ADLDQGEIMHQPLIGVGCEDAHAHAPAHAPAGQPVSCAVCIRGQPGKGVCGALAPVIDINAAAALARGGNQSRKLHSLFPDGALSRSAMQKRQHWAAGYQPTACPKLQTTLRAQLLSNLWGRQQRMLIFLLKLKTVFYAESAFRRWRRRCAAGRSADFSSTPSTCQRPSGRISRYGSASAVTASSSGSISATISTYSTSEKTKCLVSGFRRNPNRDQKGTSCSCTCPRTRL